MVINTLQVQLISKFGFLAFYTDAQEGSSWHVVVSIPTLYPEVLHVFDLVQSYEEVGALSLRSQPWFGGLEFRSPSLRVRLMFPVFLLPWCVVQAFGPLKSNRVGFHLMSFCILLTMRLITAQFCSHGCRAQVQQTPGKIIGFSAFSGNLGKWPWPFLLVCKLSAFGGISKQPGLPNAFVICLPKMEEAISERPCLDFICFQPTCAVLMRTAAVTVGSLRVKFWEDLSSLSRTNACI